MAIKDVKVWKGMATNKGREARIYVHTDDGREGVLHSTGSRKHRKGEIEGELTEAEWQEARALSIRDGKWNTVYANEISRNVSRSYPQYGNSNRCPDCGGYDCGSNCNSNR
jgi:hypothetical protein